MTAIVFDIGQVLVSWAPHLACLPALGDRASVDAFFARTDFDARNLRADGGETFANLAGEPDDHADAALFAAYVDRYGLTIPEAIDGTWALMDRLRAKGHARGICTVTAAPAEATDLDDRDHLVIGSRAAVIRVKRLEAVARGVWVDGQRVG